jgi:uncharacterized protein (DUF58 family)
VLLTGLLAAAGVLLGRPDVVLLAAPLAVGTGWALRRRPGRKPRPATGCVGHPQLSPLAAAAPEVTFTTGGGRVSEGGEAVATISVANPGPVGYDLVVLQPVVSRWLGFKAGDRPHAVVVPPESAADLELAGPARRWGRHRVGPAHAVAYTCDGLLACDALPATPATVPVYPATEPFEADEAMPRAAGLAGTHRSRRPGHGGELAGVRPFAPGDRLRRVDWRVSLRTRQLHVAATLSDRDAELVLVLDVLAEAGRSGGVAGPASVLDTTVRAAAAIAGHYLHRGDRVSLVEYGRAARRLRPASGHRQHLTVLEWLLDIEPGTSAAPYERLFGPHQLSPDALVVVLTPLIDDRTGPMLARLVRAGRFVVAVDTLPGWLAVPGTDPHAGLAYRLWRLERENTIGALREHGVPVVTWAGAGSLDRVLRQVARLATTPRLAPR